MDEYNRNSEGAMRFNERFSIPDPSTPVIQPLKRNSNEFETLTPALQSRKRRSIAAHLVLETNIEENDDEAERLLRRENRDNVGGSADDSSSALNLSGGTNLTATEVSNQISEYLKMNTENKINDKNAWRLKMIDLLVYALKKHNPSMTNLQLASASLDTSAKIYGFRVDSVYANLLKMIGMTRQDKRNQNHSTDDECEAGLDTNKDVNQRKKKKRIRQHIISTVDSLKANFEVYNPLSLANCQKDIQTSDMLFQASLSQHTNHGIAFNVYNDVVLDKVLENNYKSCNFLSCAINDFTKLKISPSYSAFKFLNWSTDGETKEINHQDEDVGECHFDLDATVADDADGQFFFHDATDCGDAYEAHCAQTNHQDKEIVDFQNIISNNANPHESYEYSYFPKNCRIRWVGPSHWKVTFNKNLENGRVVETCPQKRKKKTKVCDLIFLENSKNKNILKFEQTNGQKRLLPKTIKFMWFEDKLILPEEVLHNIGRFNNFFKKPTEHLKSYDKSKQTEEREIGIREEYDDDNDQFNVSTVNNEGDGNANEQNFPPTQDTVIQSHEGFVGNNLVTVPKLTDNIFIPFSQRAKKIDMRQLKKGMWKTLRKKFYEREKENLEVLENEVNNHSKDLQLSKMYKNLSKVLSKQNAESLSPAIAFVSLLHLSHEKGLKIENNHILSDVVIEIDKDKYC